MQHWHTRHCANAPAGPAAAGSGATAGAARAGRAPGRDLSAHAPATRARRGNRPPLQAAWALQQQQAIGPGAPREAQRRARGPHPDTPRPSQPPPPPHPPGRGTPGHAGARDSWYQPSGDAQTPEQTSKQGHHTWGGAHWGAKKPSNEPKMAQNGVRTRFFRLGTKLLARPICN